MNNLVSVSDINGNCYEKIEWIKRNQSISVEQIEVITNFSLVKEVIKNLTKKTAATLLPVNTSVWKKINANKITSKTVLNYYQCEEVRHEIDCYNNNLITNFPLPEYFKKLNLSNTKKHLLCILYNLYKHPSITHLLKCSYGVSTSDFLAKKMKMNELDITELFDELIFENVIHGGYIPTSYNRFVFMFD